MRGDLAGRDYWQELWDARELPPLLDPASPNLSAFVDRQFERLFVSAFQGIPRGASWLEVGCGSSVWLPFVAQRFGFEVSGIDYSEVGVAQARAMLARAGASGQIALGDLFDPPAALLGAFDVVVSNGVVEHFEDTVGCLRAIARFARPGGRVMTLIPNLTGTVGTLQKLLDRAIYDVHVPLSLAALTEAHQAAGLRISLSQHHMFVNFGVNRAPAPPSGLGGALKRALLRVLVDLSRLSWAIESRTRPFPPNRWLSPHTVVVAEK